MKIVSKRPRAAEMHPGKYSGAETIESALDDDRCRPVRGIETVLLLAASEF